MTEREKIIRLARECGFRTGSFDFADGNGKQEFVQPIGSTCIVELEAFYKAAQNEAYESCINACILAEQESGYAKSQLSDEEYIAKAVVSGAVYQAKKLQGVIANMKEQS